MPQMGNQHRWTRRVTSLHVASAVLCWGGHWPGAETRHWLLLPLQNDPRKGIMDHTGMQDGPAHSPPDACSSPGARFVLWATWFRFQVTVTGVPSLYSLPTHVPLAAPCRAACAASLWQLDDGSWMAPTVLRAELVLTEPAGPQPGLV